MEQPPKPRAPIKRPGVARPAPARRKSRKPNWIYIAGCVVLMGVFFMPWFSTPIGSAYGYEIPYYIPRFLQAVNAPPGLVLASNSLWALAFIGVFAFFGLSMELAALAKHKNQWWLRLLTAISPIVAVCFIISMFMIASAEEIGRLAYYVGSSSPDDSPSRTSSSGGSSSAGFFDVVWALMKISGFGLWLMTLGMVLCAVSVRVHPGRRKQAPQVQGSGAAPA